MKKIVTVQTMIGKSKGVLTPTAQRLLDKIKDEAANCKCIFNGNGKYQVTGDYYEQFVVDMIKGECTCRKWEVSGIPCKHAVAALWDQVGNGELIRQPEDLVHPCYKMETWKRQYSCTIEPINGPEMWPKSDCPTVILPPKHHVQVNYNYLVKLNNVIQFTVLTHLHEPYRLEGLRLREEGLQMRLFLMAVNPGLLVPS